MSMKIEQTLPGVTPGSLPSPEVPREGMEAPVSATDPLEALGTPTWMELLALNRPHLSAEWLPPPRGGPSARTTRAEDAVWAARLERRRADLTEAEPGAEGSGEVRRMIDLLIEVHQSRERVFIRSLEGRKA